MANTTTTPDGDAVISEIEIAAPPERVFQALIDPQQVLSWWTSKDCEIESFALEQKRGGRWFYDSKETKLNVNGVSKFHCEGEVLEFDPPASSRLQLDRELARRQKEPHDGPLGTGRPKARGRRSR